MIGMFPVTLTLRDDDLGIDTATMTVLFREWMSSMGSSLSSAPISTTR